MKLKNTNSIIAIGSLLLGLILGWALFSGDKEVEDPTRTASEHAEETVWTCSMHPQIRQHEPGDCPICGMDLIPVKGEVASANPQVVQLSDYAMKLANVQTMEVGTQTPTNTIRVNGKIAVDERRLYVQSTHIPGRIEQLFVNFTGEEINKGQALARIYSPAMVTAQEELLQAYAIRKSNPRLFEAAKQKLLNWRIGKNQINGILESGQASERFTITADVNGIVTKKLVELGDYVERGMPIYELADLSRVWVLFDIYESTMRWIEKGNTVEFTVASLPGETFKGEVDFIDPLVDPQTRVSTARVVVSNKKGNLKPGMFVTGIVENHVGKDSSRIIIPKSAVLWTGQRSVVYVKAANEAGFLLREVVLGPSPGDSYVIVEGLKKGEVIVVNGTFTIDAAAQLSGNYSMMMQPGTKTMDVPQIFREQITAIADAYFKVKNALVEDDKDQAANGIVLVETALKKVEIQNLKGQARDRWTILKEQLESAVATMQKAKDLESIRISFEMLSESMIEVVESFGLEKEKVYKDFCPMVFDDKGAFWLSESEAIRNPYFGEAMPNCGEVKETYLKGQQISEKDDAAQSSSAGGHNH